MKRSASTSSKQAQQFRQEQQIHLTRGFLTLNEKEHGDHNIIKTCDRMCHWWSAYLEKFFFEVDVSDNANWGFLLCEHSSCEIKAASTVMWERAQYLLQTCTEILIGASTQLNTGFCYTKLERAWRSQQYWSLWQDAPVLKRIPRELFLRSRRKWQCELSPSVWGVVPLQLEQRA